MKVNIIDTSATYCYTVSRTSPAILPEAFGFCILLPTGNNPIYTESQGDLSDGKKDPNGERPCKHLHLAGSAVAVPADVISVSHHATKLYGLPNSPVRSFERFSIGVSTGKRIFNGFVRVAGKSFPPIEYHFPDHAEDLISARRNGILRFEQIGEFAYALTTSVEYKDKSTKGKFVAYTVTTWVEIDPLTKQYRTDPNSTIWRNLSKLSKTKNVVPFSRSLLPNGKWQYETLFGLLAAPYYKDQHEDEYYGDLVRRCANDALVIPTNSIELVMELRTILETIKATYDLAKGKVDPKKLASAYLSHKYGLRLTAHDLKTVTDGVIRRALRISNGTSRSRAREVVRPDPMPGYLGSPLVIQYNYKIIYRSQSDDWRDGLRNWFDSGLFPSLTNAWDLIPFTFVLDWFFKVESYLNAIDANTYWSLYSITGVVYSSKKTYSDVGWIFSDSNWTFAGDIRAIDYDRRVARSVHKPLFFDPTPREFRNYAELSALIIANGD